MPKAPAWHWPILANLRPELEFWPAHRLSVRTRSMRCAGHVLPGTARLPALQASVLHGMLMGFADLVFEHAGRYWVLDYKSNHLGPDDSAYTAPALQAMAPYRYDVQATIYLLALHRLLRQRLGEGYQPAQHLGGAVYYFVRGIHGPTQGVCLLPSAAGRTRPARCHAQWRSDRRRCRMTALPTRTPPPALTTAQWLATLDHWSDPGLAAPARQQYGPLRGRAEPSGQPRAADEVLKR